MADAMEMMILSFLGPAAACQWKLTPSEEGTLSTVVFAGTLIGANAFGALSDAFGRRVGFFATAVFSSIFGAASALAPSFGVSTYAHTSATRH
jgi:MFS family permease